MNLEIKNEVNYAATVVTLKSFVELEGCNAIQGTIIQGNHVIVSKDAKEGDMGLFFPVESQLSEEFLSYNNLFEKPEMNKDTTKKGFFNHKGRVRCMKLRGFKSEGFFIPIKSLRAFVNTSELLETLLLFKEGQAFDTVNGKELCRKYLIPVKQSSTPRNQKKAVKRFDRLVDNQFRLHIDTPQLGRNIHTINPEGIISITRKLHGTSFIVSNVLCKRKLNLVEKLLKAIGIKIKDVSYDSVYASRKVVKNRYINKDVNAGYYGVDHWGVINEELKPFLKKGMTVYGESVGYLATGKMIQDAYNYGCSPNNHENYVYRITFTNEDGDVFEFSMLQIQQWCKQNGLKAVPLLYYGKAKDLFPDFAFLAETKDDRDKDLWREKFLEALSKEYLEKMCPDCSNGTDIPDEGIVVRKESLDIEVAKLKSFLFKERETKAKDKGEEDIEEQQISEEE